ncbi:OmpA family protein [Mesonia maritima]|uniref:Outer membrane protein OmpA-like peptidoglycan-associated protein n=1 Tax=Mesonia maritima TaxID=1793873 RepID=A0ABU1K861_9FLAO|nr:OmpA family protein [Mesonia maritima]MDR6301491.1 outer membrane protein OmpA-like peptidoglycan-associated protein [Mesonia maritima]
MNKLHFIFAFFYFTISLTAQIEFQEMDLQKFYKVGENKEIFMPLGKISFADSIISFKEGSPKALEEFSNPKNALGESDYVRYLDPSYVSIGCGGELIVQFTDNGFIDIEGSDLYFFEIGPSVEAFEVEISEDGKTWYPVGDTHGGSSYVDISSAEKNIDYKRIYYYVKIKDLRFFCRGPTPGADIDAIATIAGVLKIDLQANLLFDTDKFTLKESAKIALDSLKSGLKPIPKAEIIIEGHTDADGSSAYNITLSKNRAESVKTYLEEILAEVGDYTFETKFYGEEKPKSTNQTAKGKQENRRVEIVVIPDEEFYKPPKKKKPKP